MSVSLPWGINFGFSCVPFFTLRQNLSALTTWTVFQLITGDINIYEVHSMFKGTCPTQALYWLTFVSISSAVITQIEWNELWLGRRCSSQGKCTFAAGRWQGTACHNWINEVSPSIRWSVNHARTSDTLGQNCAIKRTPFVNRSPTQRILPIDFKHDALQARFHRFPRCPCGRHSDAANSELLYRLYHMLR